MTSIENRNPGPAHLWRTRDLVLLATIVALGVIVRVWALACDRSFWCDEAMLAMNITRRGYLGLLRPLDWSQAAPVGFLLAERAAIRIFGRSEIVLRLLPCASGVGVLALGAIWARKYLSPLAGLTAVALLAYSETLVYYSNELKQYESDAFIFTLFVFAMLRVDESNWNRGAVYALTAIGAVGTYFSHIAVFGMGGFLLGMWVLQGRAEIVRHWKRWCAIGAVWGAAFGLDYFCFLRAMTHNAYLQSYWSIGYPPAHLLSAETLRWIVRTCYLNLAYAFGGESQQLLAGLLLVCVIAGLAHLWRTRRALAVFLWLPMLLAFTGAMVHKFPFSGRLITFLIPGTLLTAAAAIDALPAGAVWRMALAIGLCLLPTLGAVQRLTAPDRRQELRPVLMSIAPHVQPGDTIYVYTNAWAAYSYYNYLIPTPDLKVVIGVNFGSDFSKYEADVDRLRGRGRVWLIGTNYLSFNGRDEQTLLTTPFVRDGRQLERADAFGATAILYEMP